MPLSDAAIRNAKPGSKSKKLLDSSGMYYEIAPSGGKWFRFKYRIHVKEKRLSLGVFPDVNLKAHLNRAVVPNVLATAYNRTKFLRTLST